MDPEADGQSVASADSTTPDAEPGAGSESSISVADAFAEAKAEIAAPESPTEDTSAPEGEAPAEGEAAATTPPADAAKEPPQPATPEEPAKTPAQIREEARQELLREQQDAKFWNDRYVENLTEKSVDPERFAEKLLREPGLADFMREYGKAHPGVTLENPNPGPKQPAPDEIRAEIRRTYNEGLHTILADVAARGGVDFQTLPGVAEGKLGTVIDSLIARGVEAGVARELPKAVAKEREALRTEIQAEFARTNIVTPRVVGDGGQPVAGKAAREGAISWREAAELAKAELDIAS